jgi:hypothetical protein
LEQPHYLSASEHARGRNPFGIYAAAFAVGHWWLMVIGAVHSYVWLALQLRQWWIPYLLGPTALHRDFEWYYAHGYDRTIKILPNVDNRPFPTPSISCCRRFRWS